MAWYSVSQATVCSTTITEKCNSLTQFIVLYWNVEVSFQSRTDRKLPAVSPSVETNTIFSLLQQVLDVGFVPFQWGIRYVWGFFFNLPILCVNRVFLTQGKIIFLHHTICRAQGSWGQRVSVRSLRAHEEDQRGGSQLKQHAAPG